MTDTEASGSTYPANISVDYQARNSRLLAVLYVIGIKFLLGFPHGVVLIMYALVVWPVAWVAQWVVLFTGSYPSGLTDFVLGYFQWSWRVRAWIVGLRDEYPPFTGPLDVRYPATATANPPDTASRGLAALRIVALPIFLVLIPHCIVLGVLASLVQFLIFLSQFAIIFSAKHPRSFAHLVVGCERWRFRVNMYAVGLSDRYPPFRLSD